VSRGPQVATGHGDELAVIQANAVIARPAPADDLDLAAFAVVRHEGAELEPVPKLNALALLGVGDHF
jgi:hypothetical protein